MKSHKDQPIAEICSDVFFPRPDMPYGVEAPGARDHFVALPDGVNLRLRVFPSSVDAPNILFFHGNGETARDYDFAAAGYGALPASLLAAEYRGYGPSGGDPSINTFLDDAHRTLDAAIDLLETEGRTGPLIVMGRSLGSAPAIELASSRPSQLVGLIVESGFALTVPLLELIGIDCEAVGITEDQGPRNLIKMRGITIPTLIIHAENDVIIPCEDAEALLAACKDPGKRFLKVPYAGHNDVQMRAGRSYFTEVGNLLSRL